MINLKLIVPLEYNVSLARVKSSTYIALILVHFCRCSCKILSEEGLNFLALLARIANERVSQPCFEWRLRLDDLQVYFLI